MRTVKFRPRAQVDFEGIITVTFVLTSPRAAESCAETIFAELGKIAEMPTLGNPFADERLDSSYRRILVGKYWIYYTYDDEQLVVWRIFHVTQDFDEYGFEEL